MALVLEKYSFLYQLPSGYITLTIDKEKIKALHLHKVKVRQRIDF